MYSIVIFKEDGSEFCEGVPSSWIFEMMNRSYCFWPGTNNVSILIKKLAEPSTKWKSVPCAIKCTADTYEEMIHKRKEAEKYTTDASSEVEEHSKVTSKNNSIKVNAIINSARSYDETAISRHAKKKKTLPFNGEKKTLHQSPSHLYSGTDCNLPLSPAPLKTTRTVWGGFSPAASTSANSRCFASATSAGSEIKLEDIYKLIVDSNRKHEEALKELHKEIINCREEIKVIKNMSKKTQTVTLVDNTTLPSLPIKTIDQLNELETTLRDETETNYLVNKLSILGGKTSRSVVNSIMNYVIGREVAVLYSLHGRCSKKAFTELKLYSCIFEACRRNPVTKNESASELSKFIGLNLVYAKDRIEKKKNSSSNYSIDVDEPSTMQESTPTVGAGNIE